MTTPQYPPSHHYAQTQVLPAYPTFNATFNGDAQFDVCVIGGGYTGISTALHLAEQGYRVALLESKYIGWGRIPWIRFLR